MNVGVKHNLDELDNVNVDVKHNLEDVSNLFNHASLRVWFHTPFEFTYILWLHKRHVERLVIIKMFPMLMLSK